MLGSSTATACFNGVFQQLVCILPLLDFLLKSDEAELTEEEMTKLDADTVEVEAEVSKLGEECRSKESALNGLTSALTTEEAEAQLKQVSKEVRC